MAHEGLGLICKSAAFEANLSVMTALVAADVELDSLWQMHDKGLAHSKLC